MDVTHRVVAGWILHERLGSGGFGEVWRARRRHVDLYRALKLMPVSSEAAFASWRHEIGRLEGLSHPNVVRFYDADIVVEDGPYRDCAWIATELCERSLADVLRDRPGHVLTAPEALRLLDEMLGALAAAHGGGCVHRDVKPANILLHASGAWKLCDFGTARLVPQGGGAHPHTGVVGTSPYMSAEAHRGRQDFAADLYALGVTVHEALCGLRLHPRPEGMTDSTYVKLILDTPPTVSPRLDPQWRSLIEALIGRHGPRSAAELRDQLRRQAGTLAAAPTEYLAGPLDPRASGHTGQAEAETPTRQDLATPPQPPEPRTLRHPGSPAAAPAPRPIPRRPRRRWLDTPDARRHKIGLGALVLGSLAVAGVLLHTLVGSPLAVAAVIGAVLLAILVLLALS